MPEMSVLHKNRRKSLLLGHEGNTLVILIAINLILFVGINFIKISYLLSGLTATNYANEFLTWIMLPGQASKLVSRPWTIFLHMFAHDGVWSLVGTLLWLWGFGFILQGLTGNKHLGPLYLYGGLAGALVFLLSVNLMPGLRPTAPTMALEGGKASVMAIALATTALAPGYRIFPMIRGGIPLWVLTLVFVVMDYATIPKSGLGIGLAHFSGALVGFLYMSGLKKGNDWGDWMHRAYNWFFSLFQPVLQRNQTAKLRKEFFYNTEKQTPFVKKPNVTQQRVDELLDKINQKGMHTLSEEEKEYLRQASREDL